MMKKIFPVLVFLALGTGVFAQGFLNYPPIINNGTILINAGIGYGKTALPEIQCPPLSATIDFAVPMLGLPFTFGLATGFSSEKSAVNSVKNLPIGLRIAWHFGFNAKRLDTYLLFVGGGIVEFFEDKTKGAAWFWGGIGGRYYFLPWLGAYLEVGYGRHSYISGGISFRL
jgi:hypothetical protein